MNNKVQFWTTFITALIGALAWTPNIIKWLQPNKIVGKMISRYANLNGDKTETYFIFKLAILSKNKDFNLDQIKYEIEDMSGNRFRAAAQNSRIIVFAHDGQPHKLIIPTGQFLNYATLLPADKNIAGYICFKFKDNLNRKLLSTTFIFESFDNKAKTLRFNGSDISEDQLFFDDEIWKQINTSEIREHSVLKNKAFSKSLTP